MQIMASRRLTFALLLAIVLAAAASLYAADRVRGHEGIRLTRETALLTSNRDVLKICVESLVPGTSSQALVDGLRGGLPRLTAHPDFQRAGLGNAPVTIVPGCPAPPTIADPRYDRLDMSGRPRIVTEPSEYRLFVFVAPTEQLAAAFDWSPRLTPQEMLCGGSVCQEATTALYLTLGEVTNRAVLERGLVQGVGLWPEGRPRTNPAFDPDPAATPRSR